MDFSELLKKPHLSASSIGDYRECSLHYRFSRIDRLQAEFVSDSLVFGKTLHRVVALFHQGRLIGTIPDLTELQDRFVQLWTTEAEANDRIRYCEGKDFHTLRDDGKALVQTFYDNFPLDDNVRVISIEEPFCFSVAGTRWPVIGITDLVEEDEAGNIIVSDAKFLSKAMSNDQIDRHFQLTLYHRALVHAGYGDRNILLRLDCVIKNKTPRFVQYFTSRTDEDITRAEKIIRSVHEAIEKEVFIPNDLSWRCKNCGYKTFCDSWFTGTLKEAA
jgi:putative RecB family exonuclease